MAAVLLLIGWNSLRSEQSADRRTLTDGPQASGKAGAGDGTGSQSGLEFGPGGRRITVDVSGEVRRPGVYQFQHGQRVIDAINRAGGPTRAAFPAAINRAAVLADGQQVVLPSRVSAGSTAQAAAAAGSSGGAGGQAPISLGTATQAQLEQIEGIGPVTAQSILEFRDSKGGISSVAELDQVSGIGPVTMEALKSRLQP
jgi:competence protein ComEA